MREPRWLSSATVMHIHSESIARYGGEAGIRDTGLLESALGRPRNLFAYDQETTPFRLATSCCHGLIKNHPFIDGNKPIGLLSAATFLAINGYVFAPHETDIVTVITAVAAGDADETLLARWFHEYFIERSA